jgi:hypothetical protein
LRYLARVWSKEEEDGGERVVVVEEEEGLSDGGSGGAAERLGAPGVTGRLESGSVVERTAGGSSLVSEGGARLDAGLANSAF